jgi:hypothetical protein
MAILCLVLASMLKYRIHKQIHNYASEDNTTHYWGEQQARGKLQISEETEQWANENKK